LGVANYWQIVTYELMGALQDGIIDGRRLEQLKSRSIIELHRQQLLEEIRQAVKEIFGVTPI